MLCLIPVFMRFKQRPQRTNLTSLDRIMGIDWLGTLIFTSGVTCLFLALQWGGQTKSWDSATIIGLLVGFAGLALLFAFIQRQTKERSLIPLRLLKQRTVLFGSSYLLLMYMSLSIVSKRILSGINKRSHSSSICTIYRYTSRRFIEHPQRIVA